MVLDRDTYFNRINDMIGTNTDDAAMSFIEDMSDTYNSLEEASKTASKSDTEWQKKLDDLDASWRKKYKERFFSSGGKSTLPGAQSAPPEKTINADTISIEDLFK